MEEIESLDKVPKNLFEPSSCILLLISFSRDCECFYNFQSLLYKVILVCFSSPLNQSLLSTIKDSSLNGMRDYQDHEPRPCKVISA